MHLNLERLKTFVVISKTSNLSTAAKELKASQPNLGRQMKALQKEIGLTLFERHSRGIYLTKEGHKFRELCNDVLGRIVQGTNAIREMESDPQGTLKVITGTGTLDRIFKNLPIFSNNFPDINVHLNSVLNVMQCEQFQSGDLDVGIIPVKFKDEKLIQDHLFDMSIRVYASPGYLKSRTHPKKLEDLKDHKLISYSGTDQTKFNKNLIDPDTGKFYAPPSYIVDSGLSMHNALVNGLGIGNYAYDRELIGKNQLVDIFPDLPDQKIPYYYTYHKRIENAPKVKAFRDFMDGVVKVWERSNAK